MQIKEIDKKDFKRVIQYAIKGMHFDEYLKNDFILWSYVKKKYKLNMPFLRLAYPAKASAFSSNAA